MVTLRKFKALYYINQFYAGVGGEEKADVGLMVFDEKKGPAIGIEKFWDGQMEVVKTLACGDNYINADESYEQVKKSVEQLVKEVKPNVFIAGPAFNAGRYGVACAKLCDFVRKELQVPSITGMHIENPAVSMFVKDNYIVSTSETAAGMGAALPVMASMALKLAKGDKIGPALKEGYIPTGHRYNEYHEKKGAERVVDLLLKKLKGEPYVTEIPIRKFEQQAAAPPLTNTSDSLIAIVTTGGLVPKGNPDNLRQAFSTTFAKYDIENLVSVPAGDYESIHGGYDTTNINLDPNRLVPLDELRNLEKEGKIKSIYKYFYTTCGIGTNVKNSTDIGKRIAEELKEANVDAVILTST
jgi:betaine reductase